MKARLVTKLVSAICGTLFGVLIVASFAFAQGDPDPNTSPKQCDEGCTTASAACCSTKYSERADCMACCTNMFTAFLHTNCDNNAKFQDCVSSCPF